jgi:microcin C transport system substrate-binding protein
VKLTRRTILQTGVAALAVPAFRVVGTDLVIAPALAQTPAGAAEWRHALSLFGEVRYPAGFKHFEYVNPTAPKSGRVRQIAIGTFDNLNRVIAGLKGSIAGGIALIDDTLMESAEDEVSTAYGLLAESVRHPADFSSVTYRLRAEAKWHDGKPVTADDVIFSFDIQKKHSPQLAAYYRHVVKAEKTGEREVTFTFDGPGNRELPQIVGQLAVLPKHWWEGTDAQGRKRDASATTLEPPLGCGAYRIKEFVPGRSITYERVKDYWGRDLNVNVGRNNFDLLQYEYFRDSTVALEAFKADRIDWRTENSAKEWATGYDFPAVQDKRVIKEEFPIRSFGVMQAFAFNTRREKFSNPYLRRAFNFAFDFEDLNQAIFFGQYRRIDSYFDGTELAWNAPVGTNAGDAPKTGGPLPQGLELQILETVRGKVPPEVFTTPFTNPVGGSPQAVRANLREAFKLLRQTGYEIRNRKLVNAKTGEPFTVEFLLSSPTFERVVLRYQPALERLGITATVRTVDSSQYENRLRNWDFDVIIHSWGESLSPGNEQLAYWGSRAADQAGSQNVVGIKDEAIDALIQRIIFAKDRAELVAATKALDRVLLWHHYVVPQWTYGKVRSARWDRFGHPETLPKYGMSGWPSIWWWDEAKAAKVGGRS